MKMNIKQKNLAFNNYRSHSKRYNFKKKFYIKKGKQIWIMINKFVIMLKTNYINYNIQK